MSEDTQHKHGQWPKVIAVIVVWMVTIYIIMNESLCYDGPGDLFALMFFLLGALVFSLAIWWGFSLDVRFQIGSTDSGSVAGHTTFGRGFAFGAMIIALALYIPTANVARKSRQRSMDAYDNMTQVLRAKEDIPAGYRLRSVDLGYMSIPKTYANAQYLNVVDKDAIIGALVKTEIKAGSPILRVFLKTREEENQPGVNVESPAPQP